MHEASAGTLTGQNYRDFNRRTIARERVAEDIPFQLTLFEIIQRV